MTDKEPTMTDEEIALRAALNVLRDTLESRRMPSGLPFEPAAAEKSARCGTGLLHPDEDEYEQWLRGSFDDLLAFQKRCFPDASSRYSPRVSFG